jgi:hypothetical protein
MDARWRDSPNWPVNPPGNSPRAGADEPCPARHTLYISRIVEHIQALHHARGADRARLSPRTVGAHLTSIYSRLNVSSRTAAARIALAHRLV